MLHGNLIMAAQNFPKIAEGFIPLTPSIIYFSSTFLLNDIAKWKNIYSMLHDRSVIDDDFHTLYTSSC